MSARRQRFMEIILAAVGSFAVPALQVIGHARMAIGHMYMSEPVSRQYYRSRIFEDRDSDLFETCPRCYDAGGYHNTPARGIANTDPAWLSEYGDGWYPIKWVYDKGEIADNGNFIEPDEIAVRHGVCGDPRNDKPDTWKRYGTPNEEWPVLTEYKRGQSIEIKLGIGTHHWGHVEFFVCDAEDLDDPDGVVTQGCFNKYPLTRSAGDGVNSPIDPNFTGRYYVNPSCTEDENDAEEDLLYEGFKGYVITMNYDLPKRLTCEHCILQMVHYTGIRCKFPGYDEFNPTSWPSECGPDKSDWVFTDTWECGSAERAYAQQFWNCADMTIV